jgi:hypothetical protein
MEKQKSAQNLNRKVGSKSATQATQPQKISQRQFYLYVVIGFFIVLCFLIVACGLPVYLVVNSVDSSQNVYRTTAINQVKKVGYFEYKLLSVEKKEDTLVIGLEVENLTLDARQFNKFLYLDLRDETGRSFPQDAFYEFEPDEELNQNIALKSKITGKVAFDIGNEPKELYLRLQEYPPSEENVYFRIK